MPALASRLVNIPPPHELRHQLWRFARYPVCPRHVKVEGCCRYTSSSSTPAARRQRPIKKLFNHEPNVDINSLQETLEAHREANRASVIRWVVGDGGKDSAPILIPPRINKSPRRAKNEKIFTARHVNLDRMAASLPRGLQAASQTVWDYEGRSMGVTRQWEASSSMSRLERCPWMAHLAASANLPPAVTPYEHLSREIRAFEAYMLPRPAELEASTQALTDICAAIREFEDDIEIQPIGSRCTGLATPFSDIDLNVTRREAADHGEVSSPSFFLLSSLNFKFSKAQYIDRASRSRRVRILDFITKARVPILHGVHDPTGLEFQIQSTPDGFPSTEYTKAFTAEYPTLRALFFVLKHALGMRGLRDGAAGGMTSYPLMVMILAALRFAEGRINRLDAGRQLLHFLEMYTAIDFYTTGISLSPLRYLPKQAPQSVSSTRSRAEPSINHHPDSSPAASGLDPEAESDYRPFCILSPTRPFLMSLQNPADPEHDISKAIDRIKDVQATFTTMLSDLTRAMKTSEETPNTQTPLLTDILGGDYQIFEQERSDLARRTR